MSKQHHTSNTLLALQILDAGFHVERDLLPEDRRLVVVEARVHRQHEKAAACQLAGGNVAQVVVDAMDQQDADLRLAGIGPVEHGLDREGVELYVDRAALRQRRLRGEQPDDDCANQEKHSPIPLL